MTPFESEAWLNQLERRARKRRQDQVVRLLLVIAAEPHLIDAVLDEKD